MVYSSISTAVHYVGAITEHTGSLVHDSHGADGIPPAADTLLESRPHRQRFLEGDPSSTTSVGLCVDSPPARIADYTALEVVEAF